MAIKVGFIGCGNISRGHLKRVNDNPSAQVAALCDKNKQVLKERAKIIGRKLPFYTDYEAMLAKEELDAAIICTPHTLHFKQVKDCLERGLHVLVEKPMVCKAEHARILLETSSKRKRILMVSYQRHYEPKYLMARNMIERGDLGDVFFASAYLSQSYVPYTKTWRGRMDLAGGGELMDSGSHIVDIVCWLTQLQPVEVSALISNQFAEREEVDILSSVSIRFDNGAIASISINGNAPWYESLLVSGTRGTLSFADETRLRLPDGKYADLPQMPKGSSPDDNFIAAIQGKEKPLSTGEDGLKVALITEAAYLSNAERRVVRIDEV